MLTLKFVEIAIAFVFHSFENPNGCKLDYFFNALNIRHNFSYKLIQKSTGFLKLSLKTAEVHLIIDISSEIVD